MEVDVDHIEFEHTPGNHRPFMLVAFADGQAIQLWMTEQQVSEIWTKAMAPLMAYRAMKSTPHMSNDMMLKGDKDCVMTRGFFDFLTEHPEGAPRIDKPVGSLFKRQDKNGQWWFCEPETLVTAKGANYVNWHWLPITSILESPVQQNA